jgi:hypothetical protein
MPGHACMPSTVYLLTWESNYGDEGEGREHVAVYASEADALLAVTRRERPARFSPEGGYKITAVPFIGAAPDVMACMADEASVELHGFKATITRSGGTDGAVVVYIDGPEESPDREHDELPDGTPRVRILLNDDPVFAAVPYEPRNTL